MKLVNKLDGLLLVKKHWICSSLIAVLLMVIQVITGYMEIE